MMQQARRPVEPHANRVNKSKSYLYYARGVTPKRVTSGGDHLRCFAPGQHNSEKIYDTVSDLTGQEIEPQTSRTNNVRLTTEITSRLWTEQLYPPVARVIEGIAIGAGGSVFIFQAYQSGRFSVQFPGLPKGIYVYADSNAFNHSGNRLV